MSEMNEKARSALSDATRRIKIDSGTISGVSETVTGVSEKLKGTVKVVPEKSDELSNKIDKFLDERSDQIIKDWELATKKDITNLETRYEKLSTDMGRLDSNFNEYRELTNKTIKKLEERLEKLETVD